MIAHSTNGTPIDEETVETASPGTSVEASTTDEQKLRYLSLLSREDLVGIVLSLDRDRDTEVFPHNLEEAVTSLAAARQDSEAPDTRDIAPALEGDASVASVQVVAPPPEEVSSPPDSIPAEQVPQTMPQPPPFLLPFPLEAHPKLATPPTVDVPANPSAHSQEDRATSPNAGSSSSFTNGMPSYEEMICMALTDLANPDGSPPKAVFEWMINRFPLMTNFRPSAHQALQKAFKRGRLLKVGKKYRLNPDWGGGSTSRRTTRRPQTAGGVPAPVVPFPTRIPGIPWQMQGVADAQPQAEDVPPSEVPATPQTQQQDPLEILKNAPTSPTASLPAAALLQAIAGINGMIDVREGEDGDAEGEVEVLPDNGPTLEDDAPGEPAVEPPEPEDEETEDEGTAEDREALRNSLMRLANHLNIVATVITNIPP